MNNQPDKVIYAVFDNAATAFEIEQGIWPAMAKPETKQETIERAALLNGTPWKITITPEGGKTAETLKNE